MAGTTGPPRLDNTRPARRSGQGHGSPRAAAGAAREGTWPGPADRARLGARHCHRRKPAASPAPPGGSRGVPRDQSSRCGAARAETRRPGQSASLRQWRNQRFRQPLRRVARPVAAVASRGYGFRAPPSYAAARPPHYAQRADAARGQTQVAPFVIMAADIELAQRHAIQPHPPPLPCRNPQPSLRRQGLEIEREPPPGIQTTRRQNPGHIKRLHHYLRHSMSPLPKILRICSV